MSCWRVLELSEQPDGEQIPQLLVKPIFNASSYVVHLTCLSNIWTEELDLEGIVDRASGEQSPIEVSKQDTAQLAILLDNVKGSLTNSDDATCRITRSGADAVTLHTTIALPEPLDCLTWKFHLSKRPSTTLKNELILPLLLSSHIQHERTTMLISIINDKDKAITRLVDQFDSSNLDLAAAFPIISGLKNGRKTIKREQAAKHIPALRPFHEETFKEDTGQLRDPDVTTLGLFQEALSECTPRVSPALTAEEGNVSWWEEVPSHLSKPRIPSQSKAAKPVPVPVPVTFNAGSGGDETEDEFETHENFKTRNIPAKAETATKSIPKLPAQGYGADESDETEDDGDLDAVPKRQSQNSKQAVCKPPSHTEPHMSEPSPPRKAASPAAKAKSKGFKIGGRAKRPAVESPPPTEKSPEIRDTDVQEPLSSQLSVEPDATPKKTRRTFKIGGKGKGANGDASQRDLADFSKALRTRAAQSLTAEVPSPPPAPTDPVKEETPEPDQEETPEEKAERRRAELKRKTEEAAKKQAQTKKKRRF